MIVWPYYRVVVLSGNRIYWDFGPDAGNVKNWLAIDNGRCSEWFEIGQGVANESSGFNCLQFVCECPDL